MEGKEIVVGLMAFCLSLSASAQVVQKGVVVEYNEKAAKTALAGVEVRAQRAQSTVSDKKGSFVLDFPTLKAGDRVAVRRIEKPGYEIFNKEAVEQWNINPSQPFTVVMCRSDRFKRIRDGYERAASASYERQFRKEKSALEKERAAGKLREEEYEKELRTLQESYDSQLDKLENYVDRFARIDLSELSAEEQGVLDLVAEGKIEDAIGKYDELDFTGKYLKELKKERELGASARRLAELEAKVRGDKEELLKSVRRQVETLRLGGGRENMRRAGEILRQLADADTTDATSALEYAEYAMDRGDRTTSDVYLRRVLAHGTPEQKYVAEIHLETNRILYNSAQTADGKSIMELMGSDYSRKNPEVRIALLGVLFVSSEATALDVAKIAELEEEVRDYKPCNEAGRVAKMMALMALGQLKKTRKMYGSAEEYSRELKEVLNYADELAALYGENFDGLKLALAPAGEYLPILLSERRFEEFDSIAPRYGALALKHYRKDPDANLLYYRTIAVNLLTREIMRPGAAGFLAMYKDYIADIKGHSEETPQLVMALAMEFAGLENGMMMQGTDPGAAIDFFLAEYPAGKYSEPVFAELYAMIVLLPSEAGGDISKYEDVVDKCLRLKADSAMAHLAKGLILHDRKDLAGARKELEAAGQCAGGLDLTQTRLYKLLNNE